MSKNVRTFMFMALPLLAFAIRPSAANAQSLTGNYPVLETQVKAGIGGNIKGGNQNYCLVLNDDAGFGRAHSGEATLEGFNGGSLTGGVFYVIGNNILVNFVVGSDTGEASSLIVSAPVSVSKGTIGTGIIGLTGGVPSTGLATVGGKGGC